MTDVIKMITLLQLCPKSQLWEASPTPIRFNTLARSASEGHFGFAVCHCWLVQQCSSRLARSYTILLFRPTLLFKEPRQNLPAFCAKHAANHLRAVIEPRIVEKK